MFVFVTASDANSRSVGVWPLADMPIASANVCFGKADIDHLLLANLNL
jgi:hypothetical protein